MGLRPERKKTTMSLIFADEGFTHILRLHNTNIDGKVKIAFALTAIKGIGRRFANLVCKMADVDLNKRAGELNEDEQQRILAVIQNPRQFKIPDWFLNRQKDHKDGKWKHLVSSQVDQSLREDIERMKKIRLHRGLRHHWCTRVRGQHTKTTGRRGHTVGVAGKKA
eukprot:c12204_g1_i1.p2 GENE.c12204_g1_i1~~c12204_g1_i1.p2  ORF type:complete len:166 (-),score=42.03 c12204_g1_i1:194-691(-)